MATAMTTVSTGPNRIPTTREPAIRAVTVARADAAANRSSMISLQEMGLISPHPQSRFRRHRDRRQSTQRNRLSTLVPQRPQPTPSDSSEDGKWRPQHDWSSVYDNLYAKKCMAILLEYSPRKSNYMILNGKKWIIDWSSGTLRGCGPPEYGEEEVGTFILGPFGKMIRV